jgi:hypothetical protein
MAVSSTQNFFEQARSGFGTPSLDNDTLKMFYPVRPPTK